MRCDRILITFQWIKNAVRLFDLKLHSLHCFNVIITPSGGYRGQSQPTDWPRSYLRIKLHPSLFRCITMQLRWTKASWRKHRRIFSMTDFTELSHYDSVMAGAVEMGFTLSDLHNRDKDSVRLLLFFSFFSCCNISTTTQCNEPFVYRQMKCRSEVSRQPSCSSSGH